MRSIRIILPAFWLAVLAWSPPGASTLQAQEPSPYGQFEVLILPEYEHPGVEVRIEGSVKPGQFPRYLELDVSPNTRVALLTKPGPQGEPVSERIESREENGRTYLPVDVSEARFVLRYFFNPFDGESVERTFTYELTTNELLSEFHLIIQKPAVARNFKHSLTEAEEQVGEFGLIYYQQHVQELLAGASFSVTVDYDNPTNAFTMTELQTRMERKQAEGDADVETLGERPLSLITVLFVLALLGVCMFIVLRLWSRRKATASDVTLRKARNDAPTDSADSLEERKFCNGCGAPRRSGARFCSECGKEF
ncbi:MAG: zinc ribbon domain-containing protein [Fidelibacterota bacterium]|nr:MAG: zinc ribbon domain-containing protein [Candidatus Neomarinimicrobiota bacterium]